jgi:hypothetical protein
MYALVAGAPHRLTIGPSTTHDLTKDLLLGLVRYERQMFESS